MGDLQSEDSNWKHIHLHGLLIEGPLYGHITYKNKTELQIDGQMVCYF